MSQTAEQALDLAVAHKRAGRLAEAEQICRQLLSDHPQNPQALHLMGLIARRVGKPALAIDLISRAITAAPREPAFYNSLGLALFDAGQIDQAAQAYSDAVRLKPDLAEAHNNFGNVLRAQGQVQQAISAYQRAIAFNPDYATAHNNLGVILAEQRRYDAAIAACQKAIQSRPDFAGAYYNLANALQEKRELGRAAEYYRHAIAIDPSVGAFHVNLANVLRDAGDLDAALASYRQAVAVEPREASFHSNLLYLLYFLPQYDAQMIHEEHRLWNAQHAQPLASMIRPHTNDRNPDRPLRIGYISPDFREHCQAFFTMPLFSNHDAKQYHVFCYSDVTNPDALTTRLQSHARQWRNIRGLSDEQVADLIRQDQIDILIDLTLHMSDNRLLVFARKPAPVQITWLGYPGTTGLETIDYRITDPHLDPQGKNESFYSERSIHLPDSFWCYDPLEREAAPNALPALATGHVTFGCLNNFSKVNDGVLSLWAVVLKAAGGSRMLILADPGRHRQRALDRLSSSGIDPKRIEFADRRPRKRYLELYYQIDIALDTFPYNGHTTSLDSLWMGVPVVTLPGQMPISRGTLSLLSNLGQTNWAADTQDDYVRIAASLAGDLHALSQTRSSLRERMKASPLMDAPRFASNLETTYRQVWKKWCEQGQ